MKKKELERKLIDAEMDGYIIGLNRSIDDEYVALRYVSHIYRGDFDEPEVAMCPKGMDKDGSFSIWRNNLGTHICKTCIKNTLKEIHA